MTQSLALFDFDKTLVTRDSFRLFGDLLAGNVGERAYLFALAAAYKIGFLGNGDYKAYVLRAVWASRDEAAREASVRRLHDALRRCEHTPAVRALHGHLEEGDAVAILSASPRFYLESFVHDRWSDGIDVYGSEVHSGGPCLTVDALYGEKKRTLAEQIIQQRGPATVWAYTDHVSDLPLLELADRRRLVNPSRALRHAVDERGLSCETIEGQ